MDFEWHEGKAAGNRRKHRVPFDEAMTVFADPYALTNPDEGHSGDKDREITVGVTEKNRVVVVVTTQRQGLTRIITARKATQGEVMCYEEEIRRANRGER